MDLIKYTIKEINSKYNPHWDFSCLHYLFNEVKNYFVLFYFFVYILTPSFVLKEIEGRKGETVLKEIFPKIIKLALDLPKKICKPIPILKAGWEKSCFFVD